MRALALPALVLVACAGCQMTYTEAEPPSGPDALTAAAAYLESLGEGACAEAGWSAAFVTGSDGTLRTAVACGADGAMSRVLGRLGPAMSEGDAAPGGAAREVRVSIRSAGDQGLDAAGAAVDRALELAEDCEAGASGVSSTAVDDAGGTVEIRVECERR